MGTVLNLLAGTPTLYVAPTGEALPELDDLEPPVLTISTPAGNWTAVGFTANEFKLTYTPEFEGVRVNEAMADVKLVLVGEAGEVSLELAENDLTAFNTLMNASTLATVAAGADQVAQDTLGLGGGSAAEKALLFVGTSPEGGSRVIHVPKAEQVSPGEVTMAKGHKGAPVTFQMIQDLTETAGEQLFKVYDVTAVATS